LPPADVANFTEADPAGAGAGQHCLGKERVQPQPVPADASAWPTGAGRPLVKIVEAYQRLFGAELTDLYEFRAGALGTAGAEVSVTWSEAQLTDDVQSANTAIAKQSAGVRRTRPSWRWATYPRRSEE